MLARPDFAESDGGRTVADMIAGINPPASVHSLGRRLADLDAGQCRFPLRGQGEATRFCAAEIDADDWRPGRVGGCYCRLHRATTSTQRGAP